MPDNLLFKPRAEIEAVQEANFATMMDLCFQGHPYYRRVFSERGLTRSGFGSLADLCDPEGSMNAKRLVGERR